MLTTALLLSMFVAADGEPPPPAHVDISKLAGFQKTVWGMSRASVSKLYLNGRTADEKARTMLYAEHDVSGLDAQITFTFDSDRLVAVGVAFKEKQKGFAKTDQICDAVGHALREKYGDTKLINFGSGSISRWSSESTGLEFTCMGSIPPFINYADRRFAEATGHKVKGDDL